MSHLNVPEMLGTLALMLGLAKLLGAAARRLGQPVVLGELTAGVFLGVSAAGIVNPEADPMRLLAEIGVIILLFEIGLETDLWQLARVGAASSAVAVAGVALPFALGYAVSRLLGLGYLEAVVIGASLTATSVGITARVLSELGRLHDRESQIILGAAVIDDLIGLVILAVVSGVVGGDAVTPGRVARIATAAFGFLAVALAAGSLLVPVLVGLFRRLNLPGTPTILAVLLAFGLAWAAERVGSGAIIGGFAAGILLRRSTVAAEVEQGVAQLGHFFVPLFFVAVGAAVDLRLLNPTEPDSRKTLFVAGVLLLVAVAGKYLAGYAPFWFRGDKRVIGVGMIPRGEVGLIFAQMGLTRGVLDVSLYSAVTLMVMATTFLAPPLLKWLLPRQAGAPTDQAQPEGIQELVSGPPASD